MDIYSGIIYTIFLILTCILAYQAERFTYNPILVVFTYIFVVGFWSIRYGIGWDYIGYVEIFWRIKNFDVSYVEPLYFGLNKLFAFSDIGYLYVIGVATATCYFFLFKAFIRYGILFYGLFFSLVFQLQFMITNQIRQALGITVFIWAFHFIEEKKLWKYVIVAFCCLFVHFSSIVILVAPLMTKIKLPKIVAISSIISCFVLLRLGFFKTIGTTIMQSLPLYANYQSMAGRMVAEESSFSLVMLFFVGLAVFVTLVRDEINSPKMYNVYILGMIGYIIFYEFHLINRILQYFIMLGIPLVAIYCKSKARYNVVAFVACFLAYVLISFRSPSYHGVHPFDTIFREQPIKKIP